MCIIGIKSGTEQNSNMLIAKINVHIFQYFNMKARRIEFDRCWLSYGSGGLGRPEGKEAIT